MIRILSTFCLILLGGMTLLAGPKRPAEAGNLQKGEYLLYCHMNDAGPAWTAYAISKDGVNFHDLLEGDSIFSDHKMAPIEGRTRDAFITRRHDDKGFLMVCTDMEANDKARKRLGKKETWDNYGFCLLTSPDLINWKSTSFDFRKGKEIFSNPADESVYKDWSTINRVWAPQIMWDASYRWPDGKKGGYMIYYSMWNRDEEPYDRMYYSYADESFTRLTQPKLLFDWGYATIDADINWVPADGLWHMMIKKEGGKPGLFTATAPTLTGPWSEPVDDDYIDFEGNKKCEGVSAFQLPGDDTWHIGYIEYSSKPRNYRICRADKNMRNFSDPQNIKGVRRPQHGSFMRITKQEYDRLQRWSDDRLERRRNPKFDEHFSDSTLRVDYIFGGGPSGIHVMLDKQSKMKGWAGRRHNLNSQPYQGNGVVLVTDPQTGDTIYRNPFSSLFQEWIVTPEAASLEKSFENTFIVPLPRREADISLILFDNRHNVAGKLTHRYRPDDELVAQRGKNPLPHKYIHKGGDPVNAIDIAMLAEGYTEAEMDSFINHATAIANEILRYEPFASNKEKFNFVAVMSPSRESGVSIPLKGDWRDTAFGSHYSTFYSARYLTAPRVQKMHDALAGIPYEHLLVLVNTDQYGGGGIYNNYQIAAARNALTLPVSVHEFGHSFGGLADEYFYSGEEDGTYPLDVEPWEPNITTLVNFDSKWKDLIAPGTPVPTPWKEDTGTREEKMKKAAENREAHPEHSIGVYEGGGYRAHGVYRPVVTCRMRDNYHPTFCPVCERAINKIIGFYTE